MTQSLNVSCDEIKDQFQALEERGQSLVAGLDDRQMAWSPTEKSWSIAQCLDHLSSVGEAYLEFLQPSIAKAREKGWTGDGVSRPGWFERWFIGSLEPPPKRRFKAPASTAPAPGLSGTEVSGTELLARFEKLQAKFRDVCASAVDLDINRATIRSPFARILKFRVGAALQVNASHARRHLWQAEKVRKAEAFPEGSAKGSSEGSP